MKVSVDSQRRYVNRHWGVQTKFLLGLAAILLFFSTFSACLIYIYEKNNLEEEAYRQTDLVMAAIDSTREYVREVLRPTMYSVLGDDAFVLEAMSSSYISRQVMDMFKEKLPEFEYRRVALNARNPDFEATESEIKMIEFFKNNPQEEEWRGVVAKEKGRYFMRFQPVWLTPSCLRCHGSPDKAPKKIVEKYGAERGFQRTMDMVSGVVSIGIPVEVGLMKIKEVALSVFGTVFLCVFFLYSIITFFFNRLIIRNIRDLLEVFRDISEEDVDENLTRKIETSDEIGELKVSAQKMAESLHRSRKKLKDYAENLEKKVAERTRELQESENRLFQQVVERNKELNVLNTITELITRSVHLGEILPLVLKEALKVIPAEGAAIYLTDASGSKLMLQCSENAPQLVSQLKFSPPSLERIESGYSGNQAFSICEAATEQLKFIGKSETWDGTLNVPLCCRNKVLGMMTFTNTGLSEISSELQELLFSIGHQVGITIESLQNIASLLQSKELLQSVFDGITDLIVLIGSDCRFRMVNRAFLKRYSIKVDNIIGCDIEDFSDPEKMLFSGCRSLVENGSHNPVVQTQILPTGEIFEVHIFPVSSEQGDIENIIVYAKDVTEQRRIESRMQQTEKLLALGQLAAGVAHEINNPLGIILCYADILKEEMVDRAHLVDDVEIIEKHARNCQQIVSDLLNFARVQKTVKKPVSLNSIIQDVIKMVASQFRKQEIHFDLFLSGDLPMIALDENKMKQVILNLFMNSAQAIGDDGEIGIITLFRQKDEMVQFIIEDDGEGISADVVSRIFDPFFTTKAQGQGTGLGLSLAFGIIKDHGGDIEVESEPGHWTRFTINLPKGESATSENGEVE